MRVCEFSGALFLLLRQVHPNGCKYPVWSKAEKTGVVDNSGFLSGQRNYGTIILRRK